MIEIRGVPNEEVYYDFEDEIPEDLLSDIVLTGNSDYGDYGDKTLISVIKGDYYDDDTAYDYETYEELEKLTGKRWERTVLRGYCQGDWQYLYYKVDEISPEEIEEIEAFYMGNISQFIIKDGDNEYCANIPDKVVWGGKRRICEYLDYPVEDSIVLEPTTFRKVYDYREVL